MKYYTVSIDVEPDCTPTWQYSDPLTFRAVTVGIAERLQPLFNRYDACPTYLINNVVLDDTASVEVLRSLPGRFELGAHLHAEFIEPERLHADPAGRRGLMNQCHLPASLEFDKMCSLTRLFEERFGRAPRSFRAGRFSAGRNTIKALAELGYLVDSSVTPHVRWGDASREQPVDYTDAPEQPYFVSQISMPGPDPEGPVLEVPVSIVLRRRLLRTSRPLWLRPVYASFKQMISLMEELERGARGKDLVLNMMFHNVEVLPGLSPYTQDEEDCTEYLSVLEMFLAWCGTHEIESVGLCDLPAIWRG